MYTYIDSVRTTLGGQGNEAAREESYYGHLQGLVQRELDRAIDDWRVEITYGVAGTFPDFSIYDDESRPVARIEAKRPNESLGQIRANYQEQLRKYLDVQRSGHPNLYITNFLSFRRVVIGNNEVEFSFTYFK